MATVSRALRGSPLVTDKTRDAVMKVAAKHAYVVNPNASKLRQQRANTVAVVIDFHALPGGRLSEPFHFQLLGDLANALGQQGQDLLLCSPLIDGVNAYQQILAAKGADGIIFFGQTGRDADFKELVRLGAPFVVWGAPVRGKPYCCVGSDNASGGRLAARRFLKLGRSRPMFVGPDDEDLEIRPRWEGFRKELRTASRVSPSRLVLPDLGFDTAAAALEQWLRNAKQTPDAIFAATDTIALATLAVLRRLGLDRNREVAVIGFDDVAHASYSTPRLTTIRQDTARAGALLVEALLSVIEGKKPKSANVPVELIVRDS